MHHKRGKAKNQRAGCLMCKSNKMNGWPADSKLSSLGHKGFGKIKKEYCALLDLKEDKDR
jgi:hypothetical protein